MNTPVDESPLGGIEQNAPTSRRVPKGTIALLSMHECFLGMFDHWIDKPDNRPRKGLYAEPLAPILFYDEERQKEAFEGTDADFQEFCFSKGGHRELFEAVTTKPESFEAIYLYIGPCQSDAQNLITEWAKRKLLQIRDRVVFVVYEFSLTKSLVSDIIHAGFDPTRIIIAPDGTATLSKIKSDFEEKSLVWLSGFLSAID